MRIQEVGVSYLVDTEGGMGDPAESSAHGDVYKIQDDHATRYNAERAKR